MEQIWNVVGVVVICGFCAFVLYFDGWKQEKISRLSIVFSSVVAVMSVIPMAGKQGVSLAVNVIWTATWLVDTIMKIVRYGLNKQNQENV